MPREHEYPFTVKDSNGNTLGQVMAVSKYEAKQKARVKFKTTEYTITKA